MHDRFPIAELRAELPVVLPSLLACDFGNVEREIRAIEAAGAKALHLDIMDGHFVPNISYGFAFIEMVNRLTELPLDVHLMISNPERYVSRFVEAGADMLSIHSEAVENPRPVLEEIRSLGAAAGFVLNPPTPAEVVLPVVDACDYVLAMTVMPGYGGQEFDESVLAKINILRSLLPEQVLLEVDGGVNVDTIASCANEGAQLFVAGSAIFRHPDYAVTLAEMTKLAAPQNIPEV